MSSLPLGLIIRLGEPRDVVLTLIGILNEYETELATRFHAIANHFNEPSQSYAHRAMLATLFRKLNRYAPEFSYVGYHPTHPDEIGCWIDLSKMHEAEEKGRLIQASSPNVKTRATFILEVGDRVRLWRRKEMQKVWETA